MYLASHSISATKFQYLWFTWCERVTYRLTLWVWAWLCVESTIWRAGMWLSEGVGRIFLSVLSRSAPGHICPWCTDMTGISYANTLFLILVCLTLQFHLFLRPQNIDNLSFCWDGHLQTDTDYKLMSTFIKSVY